MEPRGSPRSGGTGSKPGVSHEAELSATLHGFPDAVQTHTGVGELRAGEVIGDGISSQSSW